MIRKAEYRDLSRIAEILVFTKRMKYRSIFQNDPVSFNEMQVLNVAEEYSAPGRLNNIYVWDDGIVKGMIHIENEEIIELYVDFFFHDQGIGSRLMAFAVSRFSARFLWVLEKNTDAIHFYLSQGFSLTAERQLEPGMSEYVIRMERTAALS